MEQSKMIIPLNLSAEYEENLGIQHGVHGFIVLMVNDIVITRLPVSGNSEAFRDDPRDATEVVVAEWLAGKLEEGRE